MKTVLLLLVGRALLASTVYPVGVTGTGWYSKSSWDAGEWEAFSGTNGTDSVSVSFSAGGAAATISSGVNDSPLCGCVADIDGIDSYYFSFSFAGGFLKLFDSTQHVIASAPISAWVVMGDPVYADPLHQFIGYNQTFSIVSVPEPALGWLVGLGLLGGWGILQFRRQSSYQE